MTTLRKLICTAACATLRYAVPLAVVTLASAPIVHAQTAALTRTVAISFTGVVSNDPAASIQLRQSDGSLTPYNGPLPANFPYKAGDPVTISFNATLPTPAYYDSLKAAGATLPADGIYHIKLNSDPAGNGPNPGLVGSMTAPSITGGLVSSSANLEPNYSSLSIVYNANTDTFALDGTGSFRDNSVRGAGFTYDPTSATVSTCSGIACGPQQTNYGAFSLLGNGLNGIDSAFSYLFDAAGNVVGTFSIGFSGSWNVPSASGGATQVPEPGMAGVFGLGALAVMVRHRRRRKPA